MCCYEVTLWANLKSEQGYVKNLYQIQKTQDTKTCFKGSLEIVIEIVFSICTGFEGSNCVPSLNVFGEDL